MAWRKKLTAVKARVPHVDEEYLEFLRATDGVQIDMFLLFGSGHSDFPSIDSANQRWQQNLGGCLAIGEDPSGACIAMTKVGRIILLDYTMKSPAEGHKIADSFSVILDQVLMGHRFPKLFPRGWTQGHENEWTQFMRQQKWM